MAMLNIHPEISDNCLLVRQTDDNIAKYNKETLK